MNFGEIRIRSLRVTQYATPIMFVSTTLTAIKVFDFPLWTALLLVPVIVLIYWWDGKKAVTGEFRFMNSKNEEWQEVLDILRRMDAEKRVR